MATGASGLGMTDRFAPCPAPFNLAAHVLARADELRDVPALEVLGLSLITNPAAGIQEAPLNHLEVLEVGRAASERLGVMLARIVHQLR